MTDVEPVLFAYSIIIVRSRIMQSKGSMAFSSKFIYSENESERCEHTVPKFVSTYCSVHKVESVMSTEGFWIIFLRKCLRQSALVDFESANVAKV